jgi:prepilin-type N-terminal cleavage/methylation domain-containing protein/prepilin-type processing-associated H-X9-DG protein
MLTEACGRPTGAQSRPGFTLVELLVVIGLLAVLALTFFPAMAATRPNVLALQCMNNHRRLTAAWQMYADDSRDRLVYASTDGIYTSADETFSHGNQYAWASKTEMTQTYSDPSVDLVKRPLWPYTGKDLSAYKCPADHTTLFDKPRIRSDLMNSYLGGYAGTFPDPTLRLFLKVSDLTAPGPAKTFVFLDSRAEDTTDSNFTTSMYGFPNQPTLFEFVYEPGYFHNLGCGISFGDGHAEDHRWTDPRTTPAVESLEIPSPRNQDIAWLQDHATRPK